MRRGLPIAFMLAAVALAFTQSPTPPPRSAADQLTETLRVLATSNEAYFAEHGSFSDDLDQLRDLADWSVADSVSVSFWRTPEGKGWQAIATHKRIGLGVGCALHWGLDVEPIRTPGGIVATPIGAIRCDPMDPPNP